MISALHVLTAAHCVGAPGSSALSQLLVGVFRHDLRVGVEQGVPALEANLSRDGECAEILPVLWRRQHPDYDDYLWTADVAVMRLARRPRCADAIVPPLLDDGTSGHPAGRLATKMGWGSTVYSHTRPGFAGSDPSPVLMEATLPVWKVWTRPA